jgi:PASTA domain-containing protein/List-Bact-rpt repeat protein
VWKFALRPIASLEGGTDHSSVGIGPRPGLAVLSVATCGLVLFGAASAEAKPLSAAARSSSSWANGVEAVLPANAAPTNQNAGVRVICPSAGNCSAVGRYVDSSGHEQGLLLSETAGAWSPGVEEVLPANAATNQSQGVFEIDAISCPSAGNCSAVGTYTDNQNSWQGQLLTETAGTWSPAIEAPLPPNALPRQMVALLNISCASAGNCTATGSYFDARQKLEAVLLTETDGTWAPGVEATLPPDALGIAPPAFYGSLSCPSAGNCTAVGTYVTSTGVAGVILTETAGSWAAGIKAPLPADAATTFADGVLGTVECPSVGNCSAVGVYTDTSGNTEGFLLTEADGTWLPPSEVALPANAATTHQQASLGPLSCPSVGTCSTVGSYVDSAGNQQGLLLTETAGTWAPGIEAVLPGNAVVIHQEASVLELSCPSTGTCSATGSYVDFSGNTQAVLLAETAGSWSPGVEAGLPAGAATTKQQASIGQLSCPSAGNCGAVGSYVDATGATKGLLLSETARIWSPGEVPSLPANATFVTAPSFLGSVSCPSTGNCRAGGNYADGGGNTGGLLIGGSAPAVTLDISKQGKGSGTVSSSRAGIDCGATCTASFDAGTSLALTATPSAGSRFSGWSGGGCTGTGTCHVNTGITEQAVRATFSPVPKPCVVPRLKGKTLNAAKRAIRARNCTVGRVKHAGSRKVRRGHVISQRPRAGRHLRRGAKVNLVLSRGVARTHRR